MIPIPLTALDQIHVLLSQKMTNYTFAMLVFCLNQIHLKENWIMVIKLYMGR